MLLTQEYKSQNEQLHKNPAYGANGFKWAKAAFAIAQEIKSTDILDYGCGKQTLAKCLPFPIRNYDPCIPGLDSPPEPADIVTCIDVLEHIEPEYLEAVLDDLRRLTKKCALLTICTTPAKKTLPDGRNAHLIQEPYTWWLPKLTDRWLLNRFNCLFDDNKPIGFAVVLSAS